MLIDQVLTEKNVSVATVYVLNRIIIQSGGFLSEIFVLLTIYALLHQYLLHPNGASDPKASLKRKVLILHLFIVGALGILYIVYLALGIKDVVDRVNRYGSGLYAQYRIWNGIPTINKIDVAFEAVYFVCSVELLATGIFLILASKRGLPQKVREASSVVCQSTDPITVERLLHWSDSLPSFCSQSFYTCVRS